VTGVSAREAAVLLGEVSLCGGGPFYPIPRAGVKATPGLTSSPSGRLQQNPAADKTLLRRIFRKYLPIYNVVLIALIIMGNHYHSTPARHQGLHGLSRAAG
jgi:hypothetical protein